MPMAKDDKIDETRPRKRSRLPLLAGLLLAMTGGGAGFYAVYSGSVPVPAILSKSSEPQGPRGKPGADPPDVAFVPVEPLVISLNDGRGTHLRFRAQLEVEPDQRGEVEHLMPRIVDVLNGYLRAVDVSDLRNNASLVRLRAQMLRRVQVVAGRDRVGDLLVMEFVMN
ncbi:flagellar basal body-associated FliL family protein [Roseovarius salis]|uniref:flagellar basal body-associated FliL family protein n=1 Tax=Roseovarius salis TaxID=3376063 RepID=UPI0037CCAC32